MKRAKQKQLSEENRQCLRFERQERWIVREFVAWVGRRCSAKRTRAMNELRGRAAQLLREYGKWEKAVFGVQCSEARKAKKRK